MQWLFIHIQFITKDDDSFWYITLMKRHCVKAQITCSGADYMKNYSDIRLIQLMIILHYASIRLVQYGTQWGVGYSTHLWHSELTLLIHRTAANWHYHWHWQITFRGNLNIAEAILSDWDKQWSIRSMLWLSCSMLLNKEKKRRQARLV